MRSTDRVTNDVQGFQLESLEARALLASAPLPDISELTNPSNTVVRFETSKGDVDIELFDSQAPITVANFLKYVRDGDYDQTIFHRRARSNGNPFVIQGGLSRLIPGNAPTDALPFRDIPVDAQIQNEPDAVNRSNITRTIAMAKRGGQPNSATSQFFFNMANNTFLNTDNGGFTVFGRVVNDASWAVVQALEALGTRDIDPNNANDAYAETPVEADYDKSDGIQADELAIIIDAEIIKPVNVAAFYQFRLYFPEGFAANQISEFVPMINAGSSASTYQIIVRAETARNQPAATPGDDPDPDFWYRDKVVANGTIAANTRAGVTISRPGTGARLVQRNVPFAYEIWSTRPLSANLSHYANGSTTGESFTDTPATKWTFTDVRKGGMNQDFILWQNTSDTTVNLTINFFFDNTGQNFTFNTTTEAFRRGGFNVATFGTIPDGSFAMQITSDQPIVASRTHYITGANPSGTSELALRGDGLARGVLPQAGIDGSNETQQISLFNPGNTVAIVTLIFSFEDNSPEVTISPAALIIQPGKRATYDLSNVPSLDGKRFTVRYQAGDKLLYATSLHGEQDDIFGTPFQYTAATRTRFAEGFMTRSRAGNNLFETLSVYNPYSSWLGQTETTADLTFRFIYNDSTVVTHEVSLDGGQRLDLDLHTLETVLAQSDLGKRFFSIEIVSTIPIIAQMRHIDLLSNANQSPGGFEVSGLQVNPVAFADLAAALS